MPVLLVTGGVQRSQLGIQRATEWKAYDKGRLSRVDTDTGEITALLDHRSPAGRCPPDGASHVFKAGSWVGDRLLLCTQTEALWVDAQTWQVTGSLSHPWLNDVHHVDVIDGQVHVANTGLDCLLVLDDSADVVRCEAALDEDLWSRFDRDTDYRLVPTTKPHQSHPNYVFHTGHGVWLTRSLQKDALCLADRGRRIDLSTEGWPHDGIVHEGGVWFTTTDGHLLHADPDSATVVDRYDLKAIEGTTETLGWCRGLHFQDGLAWVGFSRLRPSKAREQLKWMKRGLGFGGSEPRRSRITAYDLAARRKVAEIEVEEHGLNAIFSILPSA